MFKKNIAYVCLFFGAVLIFNSKIQDSLPEFLRYPELVSDLLHEIGLALIVAPIVSYIFDVIYHKDKFIKPLEEMQREIKEENYKLVKENEKLVNKVAGFNQLVDYAQKRDIATLLGRRKGSEEEEWKKNIKEIIDE